MAEEIGNWWQEGVFYHIYLRSFADSNGDGLGDLRGLISRLDHLAGTPESLGVDAIWLSPCTTSPDRDFGYDVADYTAIDPRYGTLEDFDTLLAEAHRRHLRVLLDLVFNHTSDQHAWFLASRSSRENPLRDWYIWRDPAPGGGPPNNWQSVFGGGTWTWDSATRQYYLHSFLPEQPDVNWRNAAVRAALMDAARFWLERGVDGFRLDVFNAWYKHVDFPDNPPRWGLRAFDRQQHCFDVNQPEMHEALGELRGLLDSFPNRVAVGESYLSTPEIAARYCGPRQLHMAFDFGLLHQPMSAAAIQRAVLRWQAALAPGAWPAQVLSNHDEPRFVNRCGRHPPEAVARLQAMLLLTLRGTPFIYYGEEIAQPGLRLRRGQIVDPPGRRYWPFYTGRDASRGPMQWDGSPHAGFSSAVPWLPVHPGYRSRNVAAQSWDAGSVFAFWRTLLALRKECLALRRGTFHPLMRTPRSGLVYLRQHADERILVALNFTPRPVRLVLDTPLSHPRWEVLLGTHSRPVEGLTTAAIDLAPYEAVLFREPAGAA